MKENDSIPALLWKPINIEKKLDLLLETVHATRKKTPKNNTRLLTKLHRWLEKIESIQNGLKKAREELVPDLEKELDLDLVNNELVQVAMFQPSTKNIFMEIETQYRRSKDSPLSSDEFAEIINLSEMAQVLALVGDAVISSAVLQHLWEPHLGDAGKITQKKSEIVSNEHMAKLCDKWNLYEYRIHFDPGTPSKSEIEHDKGTLLEAIYGIVYIESGSFRRIIDLVKHLINTP